MLIARKEGVSMAKKSSNQAVVDKLSVLLASTYTLYLKTQNYHWNVTGPMFTTLHTLFETQYTELALANDEIAERIRALGAFAPGSLAEFSKLSVVKEARGRSTAREMIQARAADQRLVAKAAHAAIDAAEKASDQATADLGTRRVDIHEKNAWMLQSHLE
jgi:starvation-inducible DNA-binding protein